MQQSKKISGRVKVLGAFGWLFIIAGCWALLPDTAQRTPEQEAAYQLQAAMIRCENETKSRVADSSGIKFADFSQWRFVPGGTAEKRIFDFDLVAKNAFGALVAGTARCDVEYDGQYWSVVDLTIM